MTNPANSAVQNLLPVQAYFDLQGNFVTFIGQGLPFTATIGPDQSDLDITNSIIDSTTIGATTPSTGAFTTFSTNTGTIATQPTGANDIVNLLALQSYVAGISWKQPCAVATLTSITLSGLQTIDTYTTLDGDRVLVKDQGSAAENGIYLASAGAWTRALDANVWDEYVAAISFIEYGTQKGGAWFCTAQPGGTLGVTALNWSQFTTSATYSAGTGLTLTGQVFSITNTGVAATTYGSATATPVFAVNAQGQITSVTNTTITPAIGSVTGLGTGVATFLTTPTSANLAAIVGDETGSGALVFATSPTLVTPALGTPASGDFSTGVFTWPTFNQNTTGYAASLAGGASGSVPYQTAANTTAMLAKGTDGQILALAAGLPAWIDNAVGTVTSIATAGTVSGITLTGGPITTTGTITLGGTLDLSSPPAIGGTTPNTAVFTTGLVGADANFTDFPNAKLIGSQANTGSAHIYNIGVAGEGVATDIVGAGQWGVGVYGTGATAGATRGIGVVGDGHVGNTADTAAAIGVRGYATQTHAGGQNIGLYSQATGGASNYSLFMASGNIYSAVTQTWQIADNDSSALSIFSSGKAGILTVITTDGAEGISTSGSLNVVGTIALNGSTGTANYLLQSNGASAPSWVNPASLTVSTATNATNAANIGITDDTSTNATMYPTWVTTTTGNLPAKTSSTKFTFNPSTGTLSATIFSGALANALTAGTGLTATATYNGSAAITFNATGSTINSQTTGYTLVAADAGKTISITTGGVTVPNAVMSAGNIITIYNNSGSSQTITQGASLTLQWAGQSSSTTGNRTLGLYGIATIIFISSSVAVISGAGLT
jgi:hypothetical protein